MQVLLAMIVFAIVAGTANLAWDLSFRRGQARRLTAERRQARPRALPEHGDAGTVELDVGVAEFVALTRATFQALDEQIDRFDFLLLRARTKARFGVVYVRSHQPRTRALALLERWLEQAEALDEHTARRLAEVALGPETIAGVLARERGRMRLEFTRDSERALAETTTDLDRAVIHLQQIVRFLESHHDDPYRLG